MIFLKEKPKTVLAESYRNLRANIEFSSIDKKIQTIVITSSESGEGKSTVAINLAYTLAQNKKNVIVVDCDLRKPSIHRKCNISNRAGLSECLVGNRSLEAVTRKIEDGINILPAGTIPPNPTEMINSNMMEKVLDVLKDIYDYIVIDTPPALMFSEARILGGKCDATIMVVRAEKTKAKSIVETVEELRKAKSNIIGTVLNRSNFNKMKLKGYKVYENDK